MKEKQEKLDLLYQELTYKLRGCFFDVYNQSGPAHKEQVYHEALKVAFADKNILYKSKKGYL